MVGSRGQSSKGYNAAWKDEGLIDWVFSWSLEDILNEDLFKTQVDKIPESFESVQQYLGSYISPLVEETRSELCSSLEVLSRAPFAEVTFIGTSKPCGTLNVQVDYWRNKSTKLGQEPYTTLPGDIFIISDVKPESVADLQYPGRTWSLAWATKVSHNGHALCIKLKAAKDIGVGDGIQKPFFVVYLVNITPHNRIWRTLHLSRNADIIKEVLCSNSVVGEICSQCCLYVNAVCAERLGSQLPSTLNESQRVAVLSSLCKINCNHKCSVELIWGPPGTGKTKTVSILLSTILGIDCRVLTCAPTNVAITELASRVMKLLKESAETKSERGVAFCSLGDMLLFGTKERLKVGYDLEEVFLDYRVDRLKECFGLTGWKHCLSSMMDFFQNCKFQYHGFLENEIKETDGSKKEKSFLDFARERFKSTAPSLRRCIQILCTHIPKSFILEHNFQLMENLVDLLDSFKSLLSQENVISEELEELFSSELTAGPSPPNLYVFESAFLYLKSECLSVIKTLQISLDQIKLPSVMGKTAIKNFCFQRASLILCTTSSSYKLYSVKMKPLDLLVIDEAAQLKECESAIPLQLTGIRHAVLIGDEFQLPATVRSKVSDKAGFGRSLFERLSSLGHSKHLLNIQYRMHPSVSCFPNSRFYMNQILNAPNVMSASYIRHYIPGPMFGPYSFINVNDGKEELDSIGHSRKNLVEVAVVIKIIHNLHKAWKDIKLKLSIGVISPYTAQVVAIKNKLGKRYENFDGFTVKVKSIDGFQGGEEDIILISTVRCNSRGSIGFLSNHQRANVVLTRARHCLWILGNGKTLVKSKSIWESVVVDAKSRRCFFNADEDKGLANAIIEVKEELLDFNDLLDKDSVIFRIAKWKVYFSSKFRESFWKLKHKTRKSIIFLLLKLSTGWRPREYSNSISGSPSQILKKIKVENMYILYTVDIEKDMKYVQVLKVWDILRWEDIPIVVQSLESIFKLYTDDFLDCSRAICHQGESEVPMTWGTSHDVIRYKSLSFDSDTLSSSIAIEQSDAESSKVIENLLLMKFCVLSYPVVSLMLSSHAGRDWDNLYQVSDQQLDIILSSKSTFLIGQPGSEKNTVLITKLFQRERQHYLCSEALQEKNSNEVEKKIEISTRQKKGTDLRQIFITATPRQCIAIKKQISYSQRMRSQQQDAAERDLVDMHDINDISLSMDIPDSFIDVSSTEYPLVITLRKFLMMLDGSVGDPYFDKFHERWKISHVTSKSSTSPALQSYIQLKEVNYDRFCSSYWPHFSKRLTRKLDAFTVFSEIVYSIKGSCQAGECIGGKLNRNDYVQLCKGCMSTLSKKRREMIYDMFLDYEKRKMENHEYDLADLVIDLHFRLRVQNYEGGEIDFVYVDEVQSFSMRQIALLKYVCRNVNDGFVFSGDRAHTIARGNDFRFQDLRLLFYKEFLGKARDDGTDEAAKVQHMSQILHLSQNFHTHAGVLRLAQSVIDLIFRFFPQSIDILSAETSLLDGELPILVEPVKGENAITAIFRNCNVGFGAQQVILVRDDATRKEIADHVGKQALILTINECQGLEFQDVLLYNFFGSSPSKYQWEVIDEYIREQDVLDIDLPMSYTTLGSGKQNGLCWELKQLFLAITRSTRRLWICETTSNLSNPIFEYWKKLSLVQVRQLDDSFALEMKVSSSKEEWGSLGIKLYCEGYFGKSTMCFEKAEDKYRESWSKASYLRIAADRLHGTEADIAHNFLRDAAELYGTIGMTNLVAQCLIELNEYEKAGTYYLENFGDSRLEAAGDCYFIAGCYEAAAKVYARGQYFSKFLSVCSFAELFDIGLQIIQLHKDDFPDAKLYFLEKGALHYHELKVDKTLMDFVRAFESMGCKRTLLKTLLLDEKSFDLLSEADLLEKAGYFKDASKLILMHVLINSLWASGNKGWPLKLLKGTGKLLKKAKLLAKNESSDFYELVCTEAHIILNSGSILFEMKQDLSASTTLENLKGMILSSRRILDAHLRTDASHYKWEDKPIADALKHSEEKISQNEVSLETLIHFWNFWKEKILCILEHLGFQETHPINRIASYEEFCLDYLGVRKLIDNQNIIYILINSDADWVLSMGEDSLQRHSDLYYMDAQQFISAARNYWYSEVFSVGNKVLEKLRALHMFFAKNSLSVIEQCIAAARTFEVIQFLTEFKFLESFIDFETLQNLFDIGLQSILCWRQHDIPDFSKTMCIDEHAFLERCAFHYHELEDNKSMMKFVRAFHSMDCRRSFLRALDCLDDLLWLEVGCGNFMEAISIAKLKGDLILEVSLLEKAGHFRDAAILLLMHCIANSLWRTRRRGWPLKSFKHMGKLFAQAKSCAKNVSSIFYEVICTETSILSHQATSLFQLKQMLSASQEQRNCRGILLSARRILDVHLKSNMSNYEWEDPLLSDSTMNLLKEDELLTGLTMTSERMALQNHLSVESLVYFWNLWKENIVNMLEYLPCLEIQDTDDYLSYGGFCLSYLGVRKQLRDKKWVYLLLNSDIDWGRISKVGEGSPMDALQFISAARSYWHSEILSVGMEVLGTLKAFYAFSIVKSFSLLCQSLISIYFCEVMKFLEGFKFLESTADETLQNVFKLKSDFIEYCNHNTGLNMVHSTKTDEFEHVFLERSALHCHKFQNKRIMMIFVKKFRSMDSRRLFLKSLDCYDELLLLEEESGNYMEAVAIARQKGDLLLEVDLLQKAGQYKEAANLAILHVLANSLWAEGSKGWPLKPFMQKEELLCKAKSSAKNSSEDIVYENVCIEANIISGEESTLLEMKQCFRTSQEHNNLIGQILSARKILDYHLNSDISQYVWGDELIQESTAIFSQDKLSVATLVYFWNCWKEKVITVMECLETQNVKEYRHCEEFCLNYFGVRKHLHGNDLYHLLKPNADWVKSYNGKLVSLDAQLFATVAVKYWASELFSVGLELVETLSDLSIFSVKNSSAVFSQSMISVHIFQVAKFFMDSKFYIHSTQSERMQDLIKVSTDVFFENVFSPDWTKSMTQNMIALRETGFSDDVLDEIVRDVIESKSELTCRKMGRVLVVLFGHQRLHVKLYDDIGEVFPANPSWKALVNVLKGDKIGSHHQLHDALRDTCDAMWSQAFDYISPDCLLYILERQLVLELYSQGCFYATKSSFTEWFMYEEWSTVLRSDKAVSSGDLHDFWGKSVHKLLSSKSDVVEWLERSHMKSDESYQLLVLRLVVLMCLVCANTRKYFDMLFNMLSDIDISSKLPEVFFEVLQGRQRSKRNFKRNFIHILAEALVKIKNPLVIVCQESQGQCGKSLCADAIVVNTRNIQQREYVLKAMFPKHVKEAQDHVTEAKSCSCEPQDGNNPSLSSHATLVQQLKITTDDRDFEQANKCKHLKKAFDSQKSSKVKQAKINNCNTHYSENIFRNNKKEDISAEVDCMTDELKKLSVSFDMSNPGLKSKSKETRASRKNKMKSCEVEESDEKMKTVKAKRKCQPVKDKGENSFHQQPKKDSKKVGTKTASSTNNSEQIKSKESGDMKKHELNVSKGSPSPTKHETKSLPHESCLAECVKKNGEKIKVNDNSKSCEKKSVVGKPNAQGSGKNDSKKDQVKKKKNGEKIKVNDNSKSCQMKSVVGEPNAQGSGKNDSKKDKAKSFLQQPRQVWEPKAEGRGKTCKSEESNGSKSNAVVSGKNSKQVGSETEPVPDLQGGKNCEHVNSEGSSGSKPFKMKSLVSELNHVASANNCKEQAKGGGSGSQLKSKEGGKQPRKVLLPKRKKSDN